MPKRHVGSFFHVLTSNSADFSYYSPHTIYLFCIPNMESTKKKGAVKRKHHALSIAEKVEILKKT